MHLNSWICTEGFSTLSFKRLDGDYYYVKPTVAEKTG